MSGGATLAALLEPGWWAVPAVGVLGLVLLWRLSTRRPPGLPPGPGPALPLLGHALLLGRDPRAQFTAWRRR